MTRDFFKNIPNIIQLILIITFVALFFLITFFIGLLIAVPLFNIGLDNLQEAMGIDGNMALMKYMQVLQGLMLFILPSFLVAYILSKQPVKFVGFEQKPKLLHFGLAIAMIVSALPLVNYLAHINGLINLPDGALETWMQNSEERAKILTEKFLSVETFGAMLFNVFMIAVLPAVGEELLFRGLIQKYLIKIFKNVHVGVAVAAIIFSAFHMQFYGFIPRFLLGLLLGYMFIYSKSLWVPIAAHFVNNAFAVVTYYYIHKGAISEDVETFGADNSMQVFALLSFIVVAGIFYLLVKTRKNGEL